MYIFFLYSRASLLLMKSGNSSLLKSTHCPNVHLSLYILVLQLKRQLNLLLVATPTNIIKSTSGLPQLW